MFWPECLSGKKRREDGGKHTNGRGSSFPPHPKQSQIPRGFAFGSRRLYGLVEGERGCVDEGWPTPTPPTLAAHQMGPAVALPEGMRVSMDADGP